MDLLPIGIGREFAFVRGAAVFADADGALGMVSRVLDAFDDLGFVSLIGGGEFLDAFRRGFAGGWQALGVAGLPCALRADLSGVGAMFVRPCRVGVGIV